MFRVPGKPACRKTAKTFKKKLSGLPLQGKFAGRPAVGAPYAAPGETGRRGKADKVPAASSVLLPPSALQNVYPFNPYKLKSSPSTQADYRKAEQLWRDGSCQVLTHSSDAWDVLVSWEDEEESEIRIAATGKGSFQMVEQVKKELRYLPWSDKGIAALMQVAEELESTLPRVLSGKAYTREA
jgi:hypothetical protein